MVSWPAKMSQQPFASRPRCHARRASRRRLRRRVPWRLQIPIPEERTVTIARLPDRSMRSTTSAAVESNPKGTSTYGVGGAGCHTSRLRRSAQGDNGFAGAGSGRAMVGWRDNGHDTQDDKPATECCGGRLSAGKSPPRHRPRDRPGPHRRIPLPAWNHPRRGVSAPLRGAPPTPYHAPSGPRSAYAPSTVRRCDRAGGAANSARAVRCDCRAPRER